MSGHAVAKVSVYIVYLAPEEPNVTGYAFSFVEATCLYKLRF